MKQIERCGAQGDILFRRIDKLPNDVVEVKRGDGQPLVVAHSETGHDHVIREPEVRMFERADRNPFVCYLQIDGAYADAVHCRNYDTHETLRLLGGGTFWEGIRQRERAPEGWRRVND